MLWDSISLHTKTLPVIIDGKLTAIRYQNEVLRPILIPLFQQNRAMQLMQDGATAHTARQPCSSFNAKGYLSRRGLRNLRILTQLKMCVFGGGVLVRKIYADQPETLRVLRDRVMTEWNRIPQRFVRNFILSMRQRCQAVIRANGDHTRY